MRGTELIIFDCDGVLVDSEIVGINIEVDLLLGAGCEISVGEFTERFSGMSWKDILLVLEQERGIELSGALLDKTEAELDVRIPSETQAIHGVRAVLQELQYPRCVCSNTKLSRVEAVLTNVDLRQFFGRNIYSAKDLGEGMSKPKPDIFLFGAQQMGFDPTQTFVIEDSVPRCSGRSRCWHAGHRVHRRIPHLPRPCQKPACRWCPINHIAHERTDHSHRSSRQLNRRHVHILTGPCSVAPFSRISISGRSE